MGNILGNGASISRQGTIASFVICLLLRTDLQLQNNSANPFLLFLLLIFFSFSVFDFALMINDTIIMPQELQVSNTNGFLCAMMSGIENGRTYFPIRRLPAWTTQPYPEIIIDFNVDGGDEIWSIFLLPNSSCSLRSTTVGS